MLALRKAMLPYVVLTALVLGGLYLLFAHKPLFFLSVRDGKVLVVSGRIPVGLLRDFREVLEHTRSGKVYAYAGEHHARLQCVGLDEGTAQRLRNVFGLCPTSRLRSAPAIAKPTVGQVLGIAWIAWLFDSRR